MSDALLLPEYMKCSRDNISRIGNHVAKVGRHRLLLIILLQYKLRCLRRHSSAADAMVMSIFEGRAKTDLPGKLLMKKACQYLSVKLFLCCAARPIYSTSLNARLVTSGEKSCSWILLFE
jgi:hypothetical protein